MTKTSYLGAVCRGQSKFGIVFRDFPGCVSAGDTIDAALAGGHEALAGHIAVMQDYGDAIPEPTQHSLSDVAKWLSEPDDESGEEWIGLYPVEVDREPSHGDVRVDLPRGLIRDLERATPDTRQFITDAARRELDRLKKSA